jgi:hypothetical protein
MRIKLDPHSTERLLRFPESGMGFQGPAVNAKAALRAAGVKTAARRV